MPYNVASATPYILGALEASARAMTVRAVATAAYEAYRNTHGADAAAEATVQLSRSSTGHAYIKVAYAAIAILRRSGRIASVGALRGGVIRAAMAGEAAAVAPAAPAAMATPRAQRPATPRAAFDAFMGAINGDAAAWVQSYALSETAEQTSALRALREFLDCADAILREEGAMIDAPAAPIIATADASEEAGM